MDPSRRQRRGLARRLLHVLGVQAAAVDLAQREAGAQPKQLAAPAPRGVRDVARGGARVPPEGRVVLVQNIHRAATDAFLAAAADVWNVTREPRGRLYEVWTLTRHTETACASSIIS